MTTRRKFLKSTGAAGAALLAGSHLALARLAHGASPQRAPLSLLVLGGTGFIGPHLVRHAVARGHSVTIFTRGRRDADLPAGVTRLVGDRNGQLDALKGKRWDGVIDDSATNPDWVKQSTELLKDSVGWYSFTSSTGVYYPYTQRNVNESVGPRLAVSDTTDGSERYGVAKAQCERQVREVFRDRAVVIRPSYIVGPGDTTDRFPYWPVRLARGGEVLAPGRRDDQSQFIDVRDLVEFMVKVLEDQRAGTYNVAGPRATLTMPRFLEEAKAALNAQVSFTQVDDYAFLREHNITYAVPWIMAEGANYGHMSVNNERAVAAGLGFRPIATTVRDTLAWWGTVPQARRDAPRFAITPEQEAKALAAWKQRGAR